MNKYWKLKTVVASVAFLLSVTIAESQTKRALLMGIPNYRG